MRAADVIHFSFSAMRGNVRRSVLTLIAMAIGVAAVIVLTTLGEGARSYVASEFSSLGTHLLIVLPGRSETTGGHPPILGETARDLTLDDALALRRSRHLRRVAPVSLGSAPASWRQREREITVVGSTAAFRQMRHLRMAAGRFLPETDPRRASPVCVIGSKIRHELFGYEPALGRWLRIGDRRFRVIGVMASEGRSIGLDLEDVVIVPVAAAQALFNSPSLFRILAEAKTRDSMANAVTDIRATIRRRHSGEDDVTVITQDAVLATFDRIFNALTLTVAGIAAISLIVAGILVMNVMLVVVSQRTEEIGLLKALGAAPACIELLFLTEAALLSLAGSFLGLLFGMLSVWTGRGLYPGFPLTVPTWSMVASIAVAVGTGVIFGVLPARRAGRLDPVQALARR